MKTKSHKAYEEIFKVLNKHRDAISFNIEDLESKARCHLFGVELKEQYGLNIDPKQVHDYRYYNDGKHRFIGWFGKEKHNRYISWSDDGSQPVDELLLNISFPTGGYIFGDDYPVNIFNDFWQELKGHGPKYIDTVNHCLYFSIDSASEVFNDFNSIFRKYQEINNHDRKLRAIAKMKSDLEKMENNL